MKKLLIILLLFWGGTTFLKAQSIRTDKWNYIQADSTRGRFSDFGAKPKWLRYFGLTTLDINVNGLQDIVSGRYWYKNPGGDMTGAWNRTEFPINVDAILAFDINGNRNADVIGIDLPKVYWLEAAEENATTWDTTMIGNIPATDHKNSQGFRVAQLLGNGKNQALIAAKDGIYCLEVPLNPKSEPWIVTRIVNRMSSEGFDVSDVDGDGFPDIIAGDYKFGNDSVTTEIKWYKNPGNISENWSSDAIGETVNDIDRICVADFDQNGIPDIVVTEERYPGNEPDANLFVFMGAKSRNRIRWQRTQIIKQFSMNNLDAGDIDQDGDIDFITAEHKGPKLEIQLFINDGKGNFSLQTMDTGKENHLGTKFVDLDSDGDLDIVGIGWDKYKYLHVWRNDAIKNSQQDSENGK